MRAPRDNLLGMNKINLQLPGTVFILGGNAFGDSARVAFRRYSMYHLNATFPSASATLPSSTAAGQPVRSKLKTWR
jgi:hypothetical protein